MAMVSKMHVLLRNYVVSNMDAWYERISVAYGI